MSTSRRLPASSRKIQPPLQPPKADTDNTILRAGALTFEAPLEAQKNARKTTNTAQNPSTSAGSTRAHGLHPDQGRQQARNRSARTAPGSVNSQSTVSHPRIPPVPPAAGAPRAPQKIPAPKPLPAAQPLPKPVVRAPPAPIPKQTLPPKLRPLPKSSLPAPHPLPTPRLSPFTRGQVTSPVKGHVTVGPKPETASKTEVKVKVKERKELTPEEKALKTLRLKQRRERKKEDHYQLVLSATGATISILKRNGLSCAVFGSLACKLFGAFRDPKDVDLLVFQPFSSDPDVRFQLAEETKALIVNADPSHFYLKLPRDPEAPYRILYYRTTPSGPSCKVDILVPGTMYLPNIPPPQPYPGTSRQSGPSTAADAGSRNYITSIASIPLVPFSLLLLHKLQGWADHRSSLEKHKKRKEPQDAADVRRLLEMDSLAADSARTKPWANPELFCEEFQQLTKERVKEYCRVFPGRATSWRVLGFETA